MGMLYTLICNDGTVYTGDQSKNCDNNGGKKTSMGGNFDWSKIKFDPTSIDVFPNVSRTPVLCKDGTYDYSLSSSNARYDNSKVCSNKGGIAETFFKVLCNDGTTEMVSNQPKQGMSNLGCTKNGGVSKNQQGVNESKPNLSTVTNNETFLQKNKNNLIIAVVLVAGYFAYKKFKK
jgi:hypothetical protein